MPGFGALKRAWEATQVELHGQYSSKRLQQFRDYCHHASLLRVLGVLLFTPVPCIAVVLLTDAIPIEAPEKGLSGSFTFWIRLSIATGIISGGVLEQFPTTVSTLPLGRCHVVGLTAANVIVTAGSAIAIAYAVGFPIPFTFVVLCVPWGITIVSTLWWLLHEHLRDHPEDMRELRRYLLVLMAQMVLTVIYPAYNYVFVHLSSANQTAFATLLPLIKISAKNAVAYALREKDDLKPEAVILNVEVFNSLLMVCCMQGSTSIHATLVLMGADFLQACWSLRDLHVMLKSIPDGATPDRCLAKGEFWLDQTLKILFLLEFVLLVEFTETIVPIIYSVFVFMALRLPNREFYSQFIGATDDAVVHQLQNVLTYSALEFASLVALQLMLRRYVRLSPLHLLAFVLEKHMNMVQSHLNAWFQITVNMMLFHFGTDFSFKFAWLSQARTVDE
ncbi:TPA: hypothetical protein N0F65_012971 [Lagenidium giganteum]|uniref:Uncharacterized protein n=1 Tax=Lagenidium giganteum TaxID=4803 RepID=A0AAV2Z721_9STRA|nr:TPA: hypothetical protein N0F65_012971 [Lagenidium giganteum]